MTYAKRTLSESQIAEVKEHTFKEMKFPSEPSIPQGQIKEYNIIPDYIKEMKEKFGQSRCRQCECNRRRCRSAVV